MNIKTAIKSICAILVISSATSHAANITVAWNPSQTTTNGTPLDNVSHYKLYYSNSPTDYTTYIEVHNGTSAEVTGLEYNKSYFFTVTACTETAESDFSDALSWEAPIMPDTDNDGISDDWETAHFGNLATANNLTDFDGNGFSDQNEFIAGTNPDNPSDQQASLASTGETISFQALEAWGEGYQNRARSYSLMFCEDLSSGTWTPVSGFENIVAANQTVNYELPGNSPTGYYRTEIQLN